MTDYADSLIKNLGLLSSPRLSSVSLSDKLGQLGESLRYARSSLSLAALSKALQGTKISNSESTTAQSAPADTMRGKLELTIVEARNLTLVDPRQADVYCILRYRAHVMCTLDQPPEDMPRTPTLTTGFDAFELHRRACAPKWHYCQTFDVDTNHGELVALLYDRGNRLKNGEDRFLGMAKLEPKLTPKKTAELCFRLETGTMITDKPDVVTGEVRVQATFVRDEAIKSLTPESFKVKRLIGRGSFGKVYEVVRRDTDRTYAMKVLSKRLLVQQNEVAHTISERNVLIQTIASPFIVTLKYSFQTADQLFLVMDYIPGGDLFMYLQRHRVVNERQARVYAAELVCALEAIHAQDVVYRDLKPENVLIDAQGHIALTDFGLCKEMESRPSTSTFCGTSEYLAPEMVLQKPYDKAIDWWSLGVLLFELLTGMPPFHSCHLDILYRRIVNAPLKFPTSRPISDDAKDLITQLLQRNPAKRLGACNGAADIKGHPFFRDLQWELVAQKQLQSFPQKTEAINIPAKAAQKTSNASLEPHTDSFLLSVESQPLSTSVQNAFKGFSFTRDEDAPIYRPDRRDLPPSDEDDDDFDTWLLS